MTEPLSPEREAEIRARAEAATPGPWCTDSWEIYQGTEYVPGISQWIGETCRGTSTPEQDRADAAFVAAARTAVPALLAELDRVRAERDAWHDWADTLAYKVAPVEVLGRHGEEGRFPWSDALDLITPAAEVAALRARVAELEAAAQKIRHLHTDSPMGPCPVCINEDALAKGDDYTVPWPCPTAQHAGAVDHKGGA